MKHFLLRYGVFTLLIVMLAGIAFTAGRIRLRTRQPVTLFLHGTRAHTLHCTAYTAHGTLPAVRCGDTLTVSQTLAGELRFTVDSVYAEPAWQVLRLRPLEAGTLLRRMQGNTCTTGYVCNGSETMGRLLLRKVAS